MARVEVTDRDLVVQMGPVERLLALHGDVAVPLAQVRHAEPTDDVLREVRGLRAPGTGVPRLVGMGTWRGRGWRDLVVVPRRGPGLVVHLEEGAAWRRLLLRSDDAPALAAALATGAG